MHGSRVSPEPQWRSPRSDRWTHGAGQCRAQWDREEIATHWWLHSHEQVPWEDMNRVRLAKNTGLLMALQQYKTREGLYGTTGFITRTKLAVWTVRWNSKKLKNCCICWIDGRISHITSVREWCDPDCVSLNLASITKLHQSLGEAILSVSLASRFWLFLVHPQEYS